MCIFPYIATLRMAESVGLKLDTYIGDFCLERQTIIRTERSANLAKVEPKHETNNN